MELQVLETKGISAEHILSIRSGSTRRQFSVSHEQPICFPAMPEQTSPMKIDVMAPVGSCRARVKPKDAEYTMSIDAANKEDADMTIRFAVKEAPQHSGKPSGDIRPAAVQSPNVSPKAKGRLGAALEAREYLDQHELFLKVQEMLAHVINDKPEDPYDFMMDYLAKQKMGSAKAPKAPAPAAPAAPAVPAKKPAEPTPEEALKAKLGSGFIRATKSGVLSSALAEARPAAKPEPAKAALQSALDKLSSGLLRASKSGDLNTALNKARPAAMDAEVEAALKAKVQLSLLKALKSGDLSIALAANM